MAKFQYGYSRKNYKQMFDLILHDGFYEIKGYSMNSGTFFQSVNSNNIEDVKKVCDLAMDRSKDDFVKTIFPERYFDIQKRIVYFSSRFNDF